MRFEFIKCHGSGNDFPLIDARDVELAPGQWAVVARALADRHGPVGGDGLLLLAQGVENDAFSMVMRNSDGSEAETCLNGLRCVARAGFEALGVEAATVSLMTSRAVTRRVGDIASGVYSVEETAGPASLDIAAWPLSGAGSGAGSAPGLGGGGQLVEERIAALPTERPFTAVAIPNPHLIAFVETIDEAELTRVGEACEAAPDWLPNRANVSFVAQHGPDTLFVRTFERGVGLTNSCGSAMAASIYAAGLTGRCAWDRAVTVLNRGGMVTGRASEDAMVTLVGNATFEWRGAVTVDLDTGVASDLSVIERFDAETAAWSAVVAAARAAKR